MQSLILVRNHLCAATEPFAENLQQAATSILSNEECISEFWGENINEGHVCVYNDSTGPCNVSSLGPTRPLISCNYRTSLRKISFFKSPKNVINVTIFNKTTQNSNYKG